MRIRNVLMAVTLLALAAGTAGCGPTAAEVAEEMIKQDNEGVINAKVDGDFNEGVTTIETTRGTTTGSYGDKTEVPKDWPDSMPIYPGTLTMAAEDAAEDGTTSLILSIVTTDSTEDAAEWYRTELTDGGWAHVTVQSAAETTSKMVSADSGEWSALITADEIPVDAEEYPGMQSINIILAK